jgi:hypothetical protein
LDRRLFVDTDHDRVLGRRHIETNHLGSLGGELRIVALAPTLARGQIDFLRPEHAPDLLHVDIPEHVGNQRSGPSAVAIRRPKVEHAENAPGGCVAILGRGTAIAGFIETRTPQRCVAHAPLRGRACRTPHQTADLACRKTIRRQQHDPRPLAQAVLRLSRANQAVKLGTLTVRQCNQGRFRDAFHRNLESRLTH